MNPKLIAAAQEEIHALETLSNGVRREIGLLSKPDLLDHQRQLLNGYKEIARNAYGRTITGQEIDEDDKPKGRFTYRITQGNVSFIKDGITVLNRNSPVASELISAEPGDDRAAEVRGNFRYFLVDETRNLDGPSNLLSPTERPNFQFIAINNKTISETPIVGKNIRAISKAQFDTLTFLEEKEPARTPSIDSNSAYWLTDWSAISLNESEIQSLGHQFFTRTSSKQEAALNKPRGLTYVEGIAGAGKTSVALGRLKFFSNFSTGQDLTDYNLQNSSIYDFSPETMTGFVLSHSLKQYLRDTANELDLPRMSVRDFDEFRVHLTKEFRVSEFIRTRKSSTHLCRSQLRWIYGFDAIFSRVIGTLIIDFLARRRSDALQLPSLEQLAKTLINAKPKDRNFSLLALANKIVESIWIDEQDANETSLLQDEEDIKRRYSNPNQMGERARAFERIQQRRSKTTLTPTARRLLAILNPSAIIKTALHKDYCDELMLLAFSENLDRKDEIVEALEEMRLYLEEIDEQKRAVLPEQDILALIALTALFGLDWEHSDSQADSIQYIYNIRRFNAIFIDEVQDFTEVQIFLMGLTANHNYNQITVAGDIKQALRPDGCSKFFDLFPLVPQNMINNSIFLDRNYRQRESLANFSNLFRSSIQGDNRAKPHKNTKCPAFLYNNYEVAKRIISKALQDVPTDATIAFIHPDEARATFFCRLFSDSIEQEHRRARVSDRESLTRRYDVHFTTALEAKGLEFDVVVIPDFSTFKCDTIQSQNSAYVSITRAKNSLLVGFKKTDNKPNFLHGLFEFTEI